MDQSDGEGWNPATGVMTSLVGHNGVSEHAHCLNSPQPFSNTVHHWPALPHPCKPPLQCSPLHPLHPSSNVAHPCIPFPTLLTLGLHTPANFFQYCLKLACTAYIPFATLLATGLHTQQPSSNTAHHWPAAPVIIFQRCLLMTCFPCKPLPTLLATFLPPAVIIFIHCLPLACFLCKPLATLLTTSLDPMLPSFNTAHQ